MACHRLQRRSVPSFFGAKVDFCQQKKAPSQGDNWAENKRNFQKVTTGEHGHASEQASEQGRRQKRVAEIENFHKIGSLLRTFNELWTHFADFTFELTIYS